MPQRETLIRTLEVKREWLLRCQDSLAKPGVCAIGVNNGSLEIAGPEDDIYFTLESNEIAEFRAALDAAISLAEDDLIRQRTPPGDLGG